MSVTPSPVGVPAPVQPGPCAQVLSAKGGIFCATHGQRLPWTPPDGCAFVATLLCHVCGRDAVPLRARFSWTYLCPRCTRIETTLAEPFGVPALTPHEGQNWTWAATLFGRTFPERVPQPERTVGEISVRTVYPALPDALGPLIEHGRTVFRGLGLDVDVPLQEWLVRHPASGRASALAYQEYATARHPWLYPLVDDLLDTGYLTRVAEG
mgnify:CR=1 FL=1